MPAELEEMPDCPPGFEYIWEWFTRLDSQRQAGMGTSGISETEIEAFFRNRGIKPELWELKIIEKLDQISLEISAEEHRNKPND